MAQSMSTSRKILIAAGVLLLVNSQINARYARWLGIAPTGIVRTITKWPRALVNGIVVGTLVIDSREQPESEDGIDIKAQEEKWGRGYALTRQVYAENTRLRNELANYRAIGEVRDDLESLGFHPATVTGRNTDPSNPSIGITSGTRSGIGLDQAVVVGGNLIGFISEAGISHATIKLITAPDITMQARIIPVNWDFSQPSTLERLVTQRDRQGTYFYCDIQRGTHRVKVGDIATVDDSLLAQANGFVIGRVVEIIKAPDQPLLIDRIIIRPILIPGQQREVTVLVPQ